MVSDSPEAPTTIMNFIARILFCLALFLVACFCYALLYLNFIYIRHSLGIITFANPFCAYVLVYSSLLSFWILAFCSLSLLPRHFKWLSLIPFVAASCTLPVAGLLWLTQGHSFDSFHDYKVDSRETAFGQIVLYRSSNKHGQFWQSIALQRQLLPGIMWSREIKKFDEGLEVYLNAVSDGKVIVLVGTGTTHSPMVFPL